MPSAGPLFFLEALPPPDSPKVRRRGTLVLLHAFPLNARMWEGQLSLAGRGWHVIAPHFRGVDGTGHSQPAGSIDDHAADLIDLLDAMHVEDAVIGGLSMGGYVAFALFRHAPSYFRALILADTRSQADTPAGIEGRKKMLEQLERGGPNAIANEMLPKLLCESTRATRPEVVARVRAMILSRPPESISSAIHALMARPDATPLLPAIRVPTLILVGEEDALTPPSAAEEMHARIAGSELVRIPGAGHLSNIDQPEIFNDALARFLDHRV
ncbi:MAG TPA: alpha/beta fold hydrolase [Vicinamibacterales bacterium]|nr:alpha/beta fold hydrolase [Vicinamibacterales bacterium]